MGGISLGRNRKKEQVMFASRQRVSLYRRIALYGLCAVLVSSPSATAFAQRYKSIPLTLSKEEVSRTKSATAAALRSATGLGAAEKDVDTYLKKVYFAQMTQFSDAALAELGGMREDMITKLIPQTGNASTQQYLIDLTFNVARVLARDNYHPAVRYNAVLMLGDLDQQLTNGSNPPVPLAKATAELLELVEQDQINKIAVPESVKLGALVGLERHTRYGIDPALKDRLTKVMLKVMASPTPEDVDKDVHDWLRSSAALVLANQYKAGPTKEVQAALTALIADKKVELDDRCTVAGSLARITYPAGADIDGEATVNALGQLTYDVISEGAKLAEDYQKEALEGADFSSMQSGRGGRGYGGEYGGGRGGYGGYGGEEEMGPRFERRQVFARLYDVAKGAISVKAGLGDEGKGRVDALMTALGPAIQVMENNKATEVDVSGEVIALQAALTELLNGWGLKLAAN
jgi:hypothetical protein